MKAILSVFRDRFAHRRALTCIYTIAYAVCLSASIYFFAAKNARGALVALLFSLIILSLPIAEALARIEIPAACYALLLFLCVGALFGSTFNFYFLIPFWDTLLHALSGWLFSAIGYTICTQLFPKQEESGVFPYLFFGVIFSLAIAALWELFEATVTLLLPLDMQEDSLVHAFHSFYLSGTHSAPVVLEGITETVIRHSGGTLTLPGYLDLGLIDTMVDMAVCLVGSLLFLTLFPLDRLLHGRLIPLLLPRSKK